MAIYEYECPEHGRFDVIKPMADSGRDERCPHPDYTPDGTCRQPAQRVYSPSAILPNGSSGDGYFFNKKSGLRSNQATRKGKRWV